MLNNSSIDRPTLLALTPATRLDPGIAIAACRAGAVGVLDLEYALDPGAIAACLQRLEQFTDRPYGVKLGPANSQVLDSLLRTNGTTALPGWIVLAAWDAASLGEVASALKAAGIRALVEAVSVDEALVAARLPTDGVVLKGNEAGGRVADETSLVLLQHWLAVAQKEAVDKVPFWVQGGVGPNSASAVVAAGAAGVVLDNQLLLTRESPLNEAERAWAAACDGGETRQVGGELKAPYRLTAGPQSESVKQLAAAGQALAGDDFPDDERVFRWRLAVKEAIGQQAADAPIHLWGQDVALAKTLADRFVTVAGVLQEVERRIESNRRAACELKPLAADAPLAQSHNTRYPLLQGPMTRVSDRAEFSAAVAKAGGLPFLALALMRGPEAEQVIAQTSQLLRDQPWGVGLLGFLPAEIRQEQTAAILRHRPPAAIIAGGRPDQASELEAAGIATYLHVPSPGLLRMFLRDGARRFIFEGRECGGHVGPRSSFVLWETMIDVLLEHLGPRGNGADLHIVFAGGIHDAVSGTMISCLAAPLAERGVKIGALMGTAYLFTEEAVATGAIVPRFQSEALSANETVLLETGPGHAIRCVPTPYCDDFQAEKARLEAAGNSHDEIVQALEWMNIGRLRVASKGLDRTGATNGSRRALGPVPEQQQHERGMYMIGQVAALRQEVTTIAQLHDEVCTGGTQQLAMDNAVAEPDVVEQRPCDVAIVGMSALYPDAPTVAEYWENILRRHDAVTEVPATHWDWRLYYDENPTARDKIVSKWGGFLGDVAFDPLDYGIAPNSLRSIEPLQLLVLDSVRQALADAGYDHRPFDRENTSTVLGVGGGGSALAVSYGLRACLPMFDTVDGLGVSADVMLERIGERLPEWTEDSFPGFLLNVAAGRVANRFDFGGSNYALDAACASSLAAIHACLRELELGTCNVAVAIGADTVQTPLAYMAFSKTHALSQRGRCCPFDANADGIVLSEGVGTVILKRLADAERDGDRVYAVIKGVGASSDGMDKGLTAPNEAGQTRAIRRAFDKAGFSPADVSLIEAHGTGTVVGDRTEATSLAKVMEEAGAAPQSCALGSVKSMIGHAKCAAGIAGLIKTAKALDCKTLPPTLVDTPNPNVKFDQSALYLNTEPRPWVRPVDRPRRAGVSAFGFGGTNVHIVLEEYQGDFLQQDAPASKQWPAELLLWQAPTRAELAARVASVGDDLAAGARPALAELSAALAREARGGGAVRLAVVAADLDDLVKKMDSALAFVRGDDQQAVDPRGVYFSAARREPYEKVALLFPGQGSQYPNMGAALAMNFPSVRASLDHAQQQLALKLGRPLSGYLYPPSAFDDDQRRAVAADLAATDVAQPAIGAISLALHRLLLNLGIQADMTAGHSYGEFVALAAAGAIDPDDLLELSQLRGKFVAEAASGRDAGGMVALDADLCAAEELTRDLAGVGVANVNGPHQTVLSGDEVGLEELLRRAKQADVRAKRLPVACAFHSPLVAGANQPLVEQLERIALAAPRRMVFSNVTGTAYADNGESIRETLSRHLTSPVQFQAEIEAMYAHGARVFIEVGPSGVLTGLAKKILHERPHTAVAMDVAGRDGLEQLMHALAQVAVHGVPLELDELFKHRCLKPWSLAQLARQRPDEQMSPSTWLVNGARSRPHGAPEPVLIGVQPPSTPDDVAGQEPEVAAKPGEAPSPSQSTAQPHHAAAIVSTTENRPAQMSQHDPKRYAGRPRRQSAAALPSQPSAGQADDHAEAADDAARVMLEFQSMMSKFLDTQRAVMLSYLGGDEAADHGPLPPPMSVPFEASPPASADLAPPGQPASAEPEVARDQTVATSGAAGDEPNAAAPAGSFDWDLESIGATLLQLLSERTGYPQEMLDLDLDLEADLGIDSIKRVEILGGLTGSLQGPEEKLQARLDMEKLTSLRTLRGILEYLGEVLFSDDGQVDASVVTTNDSPQLTDQTRPAEASLEANSPGDFQVHRALVELAPAPLSGGGGSKIPSGAVLLTDDGRGLARRMADMLADFGQPTAIIQMSAAKQIGVDGYCADLTDADEVAQLVKRLRTELGPIAGLVHTLPLAPVTDATQLDARAVRDVKSLYLLARELESDLREAGERGHAFLVSATGLGGDLGYGKRELQHTALAAHGGILGLLKCISQEWPEATVRGVDFDPQREVGEMADCLLRELSEVAGPLEVGYRGATRSTWQPVDAPLNIADERARRRLDDQSTVLVTGGARGITAEVAALLADRYQVNLILVGRSPEPGEEAAETADVADGPELKQALLVQFSSGGQKVRPAEVEAAYQQLMKEREIRNNLRRMRAAGSQVEYHAVDVRDAAALAALIDDVVDRFGGIDGLIHGAGVIEDKLLKDKTPESFDRVFGVKVQSASALSRLLDGDDLQFCAFFASIASRYGNRGQADYAAANEVLSKLAIELDRSWTARVFSVAWGPWRRRGMVADLERHLAARGVALIDPAEGAQRFLDELEFGWKGESEVLIAGGAEQVQQPPASNTQQATTTNV